MTVHDQWGGPPAMSAWEALMWRAEADPRTRSTGILLEILDREPDWDRFVRAHERAVAAIPRLRDRVVEPLLPLTEPHWSPDPAFRLNLHVHRARLYDPGSMDDLFEYLEAQFGRPLDRARPPWEATLVTGLEGGRAAYLFKFHHALSDGLGLIQLLSLTHSPTSRPSALSQTVALPGRHQYDPAGLVTQGVRDGLAMVPSLATDLVRAGIQAAGALVARPIATTTSVVTYVDSLRRMVQPPSVPRSPLLDDPGVGSRLAILDVDFDGLRAAGRAAGCSVNDAFIAGMLGGVRRYHEHFGVMVDEIPIGMPVSLRKENDPLGGNRFTGAQFAAPLAEADPVRRMRLIKDFVTSVRAEAALGFVSAVSPVLSRMPTFVISELSATLTTTSDMQVSNIPGLSGARYLAGAEILGMYPLGPRPGVAIMAAMVTYNGVACIGLNLNPDVVPDRALLLECLRAGFDEVIESGRPEVPIASEVATTRPRARTKRVGRAPAKSAAGR